MLLKFFYVYPLSKIQQLFPKLKHPLQASYTASDCGIKRGWAPPMADATNKIYKIEKEREDDCRGSVRQGFLTLRGNDFFFDKRLGDILLVDTEKRDDCYFLNRDGEYDYTISSHYTANTVGGITNRPPPPESAKTKKQNRLSVIIGTNKKGVFTHGNMAFSN